MYPSDPVYQSNPTHPSDPADAALVAALKTDPFYDTITAAHAEAPERRHAILAAYFAYSIREGEEVGRCIRLKDPTAGIAVWLLPQPRDIQVEVDRRKDEFLRNVVGVTGQKSYQDIVRYMKVRAKNIVAAEAWYLSIVAVSPCHQGQGLGQQLLAPTLSEANKAGAASYLETFSPRNIRFYERLGFVTRGRFLEPTTGAEYSVMVRDPGEAI